MIYAYAVEVERGRWDVIACGLAVWLADWFNELVNAVVLGASGVAPLWVSTGPTAYQFLIGLNVEISFMFILAGIVYAKLLTAIPSRFWLALGLSVTSVLMCPPPVPNVWLRSVSTVGGVNAAVAVVRSAQ